KVETPSWEIQDEPKFEASGADNKNNKDLGEDEAATKPVETEEVVKTLEEYLSEKAQKVLDISLPEVRKPNEGVDDSQWKDAVPLEKKEDGDILFSGKPVGFQRGGRGGGGERSYDNYNNNRRGGERSYDGYNNRENRRGGNGNRSNYVNIDDQGAFPSLGTV
ncbi:16129_t:CDS:2, partial [Entrophospora sp. SA101]